MKAQCPSSPPPPPDSRYEVVVLQCQAFASHSVILGLCPERCLPTLVLIAGCIFILKFSLNCVRQREAFRDSLKLHLYIVSSNMYSNCSVFQYVKGFFKIKPLKSVWGCYPQAKTCGGTCPLFPPPFGCLCITRTELKHTDSILLKL